MIVGPAYDKDIFPSGRLVKDIMTTTKVLNDLYMGYVDVRDVARAHLLAIKVDAAKNRRFLLSGRCAWRSEMAECLANHFNPQGWSISTEENKEEKPFSYEVNTTASRAVLGLTYIPIEQSWIDMANCLIESGQIEKPESEA